MKQLKLFIIVCFVVSLITGAMLSDKPPRGQVNVASIGWLILAAACVLSYTMIMIEESRNKK